jgi:hypothetical protein
MITDQKKPNFFVVGAAKSGTTSLYSYLDQHPDIYLSPIKEPNFFSTDIDPKRFSNSYKRNNELDYKSYFLKKPLQQLRLSFVRDERYYTQLFEEANGQKAIGECSTSYLFSKEAAANIYNFNSNSKILIIIRHPVERAISHYLMALRSGYTDLSFRQALEKDMNEKNRGWGISNVFVETGMYSDQIYRYYKVFPESQVKILLFDNFKNNLKGTLNEVFAFLDLDPLSVYETSIPNPAFTPKYVKLHKFFIHSGMKKLSQRFLTENGKQQLKKIFFQKGSGSKINQEDKAFLLSIYKPDIEATSQITGIDLSSWLSLK